MKGFIPVTGLLVALSYLNRVIAAPLVKVINPTAESVEATTSLITSESVAGLATILITSANRLNKEYSTHWDSCDDLSIAHCFCSWRRRKPV